MKRLQTRNQTLHKKVKQTTEKSIIPALKLIQQPFTENDILNLHDTFLTTGFHDLNVETQEVGRAIMDLFLHSLPYQHIACVVNDKEEKNENIFNRLNVRENSIPYFFHDYLLEEFDYDFLWIELSEKLLQKNWLFDFKKAIIDIQLDMHIPIIVLHYGESS